MDEKKPSRSPSGRMKPVRRARPLEEEEEEQAAVDLASKPSSSSGRNERASTVAEEGASASSPSSPSGSRSSGSMRAQKSKPSLRVPKIPSGTSRRVRAEGEPAEGDRRAQPPFRMGLSLRVKIAAFASILVASTMAGLGWYEKEVAVRTLASQIDERGIALAQENAVIVDPLCFTLGPDDAPRRDEAIQRWQKRLEAFVKSRDAIINIVFTKQKGGATVEPIATEDGKVWLAAIPPKDVPITHSDKLPGGEQARIDIFEGHYNIARFRQYTAQVTPVREEPSRRVSDEGEERRRPSAPLQLEVHGPGLSPAVGYVHVYLKADEIDRTNEQAIRELSKATGVGIAIAVLLSLLAAAYLGAPLRALVDDMRVVAGGKLDHKTMPRSKDEIGLVAAQFNEMTRSLRAAQRLEHEKQAIENELTIATEIQTKLLPDRIPQIAGFDLFSFYLSAKEVGGDYYDFLVIDPTHLGIVVADVSGKGVPGAMVMTMVRSLLRLASHREISPAETLKKVNRILAKDIRRGMFVTAVYAVLDVPRRTLTVSSAGHNPMLLYEAAAGRCRKVNPSGIALGFDKGRTFDENIREELVELRPGDRCCFYTDGVIEAMSERQEEFGEDRFTEILAERAELSSKDFTNALVEALEAHRGRGEQSDDITITTLKVL